MFSIFSSKKDKAVFHQPYRPSWEESAIKWKEGHIARKKSFDSLKHDLGTNILPRV